MKSRHAATHAMRKPSWGEHPCLQLSQSLRCQRSTCCRMLHGKDKTKPQVCLSDLILSPHPSHLPSQHITGCPSPKPRRTLLPLHTTQLLQLSSKHSSSPRISRPGYLTPGSESVAIPAHSPISTRSALSAASLSFAAPLVPLSLVVLLSMRPGRVVRRETLRPTSSLFCLACRADTQNTPS
jgi:hypothetical protein